MPARRRRWSRRLVREAIEGYLYISPWLIGFLVLTLGPMVASLYFSFTHYSIIRAPRFIGLDNYVRAFGGQDRLFYGSLLRTARFALYFVPTGVLISLLLAMALNRRLRGTTIYRTIFYLPTLTPAAASTLLWGWLLNPEVGPVNYLLKKMGLNPPRWLASPTWALPTIVLIAIWGTVGGSRMIVFLAGLQGVPQELFDAASIDGANAWHRLRHVTLPMISPVIFFNLILGAIGAVRVFTFAFMATGGGPAYATWFYMLHLYTTAFQFALARRWVFYSGEMPGRQE
jgi:multiple sugar transport system permease protein